MSIRPRFDADLPRTRPALYTLLCLPPVMYELVLTFSPCAAPEKCFSDLIFFSKGTVKINTLLAVLDIGWCSGQKLQPTRQVADPSMYNSPRSLFQTKARFNEMVLKCLNVNADKAVSLLGLVASSLKIPPLPLVSTQLQHFSCCRLMYQIIGSTCALLGDLPLIDTASFKRPRTSNDLTELLVCMNARGDGIPKFQYWRIHL